jgi:GNAT superfamily N-acetyltransferase
VTVVPGPAQVHVRMPWDLWAQLRTRATARDMTEVELLWRMAYGGAAPANERLIGLNKGQVWGAYLRLCADVPLPAGYCVREATNHMAALVVVMDPSVAVARLEAGSRCWAVWHENLVVGWFWTTATGQEWAPPLGREMQFGDDEVYCWDAHVLEEHQRRGLFAGLFSVALAALAAEGWLVALGGVLNGNVPSARAITRVGFRPVVEVTARVGSEDSHVWWSPAPGADETLVPRAVRSLGSDNVTAPGLAVGVPA